MLQLPLWQSNLWSRIQISLEQVELQRQGTYYTADECKDGHQNQLQTVHIKFTAVENAVSPLSIEMRYTMQTIDVRDYNVNNIALCIRERQFPMSILKVKVGEKTISSLMNINNGTYWSTHYYILSH